MEIKEAIEVLKSNYPDAHYSMVREAVDIAIATMEEQMASRSHTAGRLIDAEALEKELQIGDIFKNSSIKTWKPGEPLREEDFLEKEETTNECADQRG